MSRGRVRKRRKILQLGLNYGIINLTTEDLLLEKKNELICSFLEGAYPLNKALCIQFGKSKEEIFFDLETEAAALNKISFKPFKKRRL
jgi:hypothetical protein